MSQREAKIRELEDNLRAADLRVQQSTGTVSQQQQQLQTQLVQAESKARHVISVSNFDMFVDILFYDRQAEDKLAQTQKTLEQVQQLQKQSTTQATESLKQYEQQLTQLEEKLRNVSTFLSSLLAVEYNTK